MNDFLIVVSESLICDRLHGDVTGVDLFSSSVGWLGLEIHSCFKHQLIPREKMRRGFPFKDSTHRWMSEFERKPTLRSGVDDTCHCARWGGRHHHSLRVWPDARMKIMRYCHLDGSWRLGPPPWKNTYLFAFWSDQEHQMISKVYQIF